MNKFLTILFVNILCLCTPVFIMGGDEKKSPADQKISSQPPLSRPSSRPPKTPPVINTDLNSPLGNAIARRSSASSSPASTVSSSSNVIVSPVAPGARSLSQTSSTMGSPIGGGSRSISQTSSNKPSPTGSLGASTPESNSTSMSSRQSPVLKNAFSPMQAQISEITTNGIMQISAALQSAGSQRNSPKLPRTPTRTIGLVSSTGEISPTDTHQTAFKNHYEKLIRDALAREAAANDTVVYLATKNVALEKELNSLKLEHTKVTKDAETQTDECCLSANSSEDAFDV